MPSVPRMRTIQQCAEYIKTVDPETKITQSFIRTLVVERVLPHVKAGSKYLINLDTLLKYLGCEEAPEEPNAELKEAVKNCIRRVPV